MNKDIGLISFYFSSSCKIGGIQRLPTNFKDNDAPIMTACHV